MQANSADPFSSTGKQVRYSPETQNNQRWCVYDGNKSFEVYDDNPRDVPLSLTMSPIVSFRGEPVDRMSLWITVVRVNVDPVGLGTKTSALFPLPQPMKFCVVPQVDGAEIPQSLPFTATTTISDIFQANGGFLCQVSGILCKGFNVYMCGNTDPAGLALAPNIAQYQVQLRALLNRHGGGIRTFNTSP